MKGTALFTYKYYDSRASMTFAMLEEVYQISPFGKPNGIAAVESRWEQWMSVVQKARAKVLTCLATLPDNAEQCTNSRLIRIATAQLQCRKPSSHGSSCTCPALTWFATLPLRRFCLLLQDKNRFWSTFTLLHYFSESQVIWGTVPFNFLGFFFPAINRSTATISSECWGRRHFRSFNWVLTNGSTNTMCFLLMF